MPGAAAGSAAHAMAPSDIDNAKSLLAKIKQAKLFKAFIAWKASALGWTTMTLCAGRGSNSTQSALQWRRWCAVPQELSELETTAAEAEDALDEYLVRRSGATSLSRTRGVVL